MLKHACIGLICTSITLASVADDLTPTMPSQCERDESDVIHYMRYGVPGTRVGPEKLSNEAWHACYDACATEHGSKTWAFTLDSILPSSSVMTKGLPLILEKFGEPLREEQSIDSGVWDIDVYMIPRTLYYRGFTVGTFDYIDEPDLKIDDDSVIEKGQHIQELIVEGENIELPLGLRIGASRDQVKTALGPPCMDLAHYGLKRLQASDRYVYAAEDPDGKQIFDFTVYFDEAGKVVKIHWTDRPWH